MLALLFGLVALNAADRSGRDLVSDNISMTLLSVTFIGALVVLGYAATNAKMQLSMQVTMIYFSIYLLLPGFSHSSVNKFPFFGFSYAGHVQERAAGVVCLFLFVLALAYYLYPMRYSRPTVRRDYILKENMYLVVGLTLISVISAVVYVSSVGLAYAFSVRSAENVLQLASSANGLNISLPKALVFLPVLYAVVLIRKARNPLIGWAMLAVTLPLLLIVNWPPGLPRSQVFGNLLLFAVMTLNFRKVKLRFLLALAFVGGALIAMPLLDHFTRAGRSWADLDLQQMFGAYFQSGDFDGLQSVNNAIVYVDQNGLEYGRQLLSALLFFVPRSLWVSKGEPTGSITAEAAGYSFTNVSQPLPSEFYVDFGWAGVVITALLIGVGLRRIDEWINTNWFCLPESRLIAGFIVGFALPIYRGTLLGVLAPFAILMFGIWMLSIFGFNRRYLRQTALGRQNVRQGARSYRTGNLARPPVLHPPT